MSAILIEFWPYIAGAVAAAFGAWKLWAAGASSERNKQAKKDAKAAQERLEMDREATAAERKAAGMTDDEARKEAMRWAERRR